MAFFVWDNVNRLKIVIYVDPKIRPVLFLVLFRYFLGPLRQIADMAHGRFDRIVSGQKIGNGPGFGRRFDDYQIVHAHDGTIQFASQPGRLTTVTVRLPLERGRISALSRGGLDNQ